MLCKVPSMTTGIADSHEGFGKAGIDKPTLLTGYFRFCRNLYR